MEIVKVDIAIIGAGGGGLRTAITIAENNPDLSVGLLSKVLPMRSHTVAAEGGCAAVTRPEDKLEYHFHDTVAGGDWLCEQDVCQYFVENVHEELVQMEHWGCPWSRKPDGHVDTRAFGGMKIERTWFAADKTGFHMLHTLFQTSLKYPSINRFDEYFVTDLLIEDGRCQGLVAIEIATGKFLAIHAKSIVIATGGAGRVFRENTNGGIVTGDGMALAYRHGVALRDMEFMQYHPTCMPITGLLFTEACRGEGGLLLNKDGYRYLQDYGLGPAHDEPVNKFMELGPRDRLSQAFWHEKQAGRTLKGPFGDYVNLDLRHLGKKLLLERLPNIYEMAEKYQGVDASKECIPVLPAVHYTMGGIEAGNRTQSSIPGLFSVGECSCIGLHGSNRLGSNSLGELLVFGKVAGEEAAQFALEHDFGKADTLSKQADDAMARALATRGSDGNERVSTLRKEMAQAMEDGCGIYRTEELMQECCNKIAELRERFKNLHLDDHSAAWNTEWLLGIELGFQLEVAQAVVHSAINRKESRGAHQRLDEGYTERNDEVYLKHSRALYNGDDAPRIEYGEVKITSSPPGVRAYGAAGVEADREEEAATKAEK